MNIGSDHASNLFGMRVIVSPDIPRYTLPERLELPCGHTIEWPEGFRAEFNDWAHSFLGTTNPVPDGDVLVLGVLGKAYCNPRTFARIMGGAHLTPKRRG